MTGIPHDEPVFVISVVARMVGVHQQTLRSYEREGLVRPARSPGNTRLYSQQDVEMLRRVLRLARDLGVNPAAAEMILRMRGDMEQLQQELAEARAEVARLRGEVSGADADAGAERRD